jgi:hypothetical protein
VTKTVKTYVNAADLTAVHLECEHCRSSLTVPFQRLDRALPENCPNCNEDWGKRLNAEFIPQRYLRDLGTALQKILDAESTVQPKVKISFEVLDLVCDETD